MSTRKFTKHSNKQIMMNKAKKQAIYIRDHPYSLWYSYIYLECPSTVECPMCYDNATNTNRYVVGGSDNRGCSNHAMCHTCFSECKMLQLSILPKDILFRRAKSIGRHYTIRFRSDAFPCIICTRPSKYHDKPNYSFICEQCKLESNKIVCTEIWLALPFMIAISDIRVLVTRFAWMTYEHV